MKTQRITDRNLLVMIVILLACLLFAIALSGCATRVETETFVGTEKGDPVKSTIVTHSWWLGLPAIASMDYAVHDSEFSLETKAVKIPDIGNVK